MKARERVRRRTPYSGDEELAAVGVEPAVGHGEETRFIVLELEVLVREGLGAVDGGAARAVAVEEITALDHEVGDLGVFDSGDWASSGRERET